VAIVLALLLAPAAVQVISVQGRSSAEWTLAIYLDADNDLELWAQKDVNEMMVVGSSAAVNIIVYWDTYSGPAYAYRVLRNGLQELTNFRLNGIEPNMGDPATLREFVKYVSKNYPAKRFALLGWDHGDDFKGGMYDYHIPNEGADLLTHQEAVTALSGFHIDVLIYGACVLSTIEVAYEYYASGLNIDYYVANEGYDPMDGFPYNTILAKLVAKPSMSSLDMSKVFVDDYIDYYNNGGKAYSQSVTLSVVQISKVGQVVTDLKSMTQAIMTSMAGYAQVVSDARGHANLPWSENGWDRLVDLRTFVQTIHDESLNRKLVSAIDPAVVTLVIARSEALLSSLTNAIVYNRNVDAMNRKGCFGIAVYFPTSAATYQSDKQLYEQMKFAQQGWPDFFNAYWNAR
jgi:hypothetical protein